MHARIEFEYGAETIIKALSPDGYTALRDHFPEWPEAQSSWSHWQHNPQHVIDLTTTGAALAEVGIEFKIKRFVGCRKVASDKPGAVVNLQVAIPNLLLFAVDEVELLDDCCTDRLNDKLGEGWRILAVCPPANQRRPDYIIGRQKKDGDR